MNEDERLELVRSATEAQAGLQEIAFRLRRELSTKAPALKEAVKAERVAFRLKRELQRLDLTDPEPAERRRPSGEVRRGGQAADLAAVRERSGQEMSRIGERLRITGELTGSEDLHVDGELDGEIKLPDSDLLVGPNSNVRALAKVRSLIV